MKCVTGLLVATIWFLVTLASDVEKRLTGRQPPTDVQAENTQDVSPGEENMTSAVEGGDATDGEESDEEEQDETFDGRKNIVQTLEFCLRKGDITPSELVNCASDILIGDGDSPNPAFTKCIGEYLTCTQLMCTALLAEYEGSDEEYSTAFKCLGSCVPQLFTCLARSTPIPPKT